MAGNNIQITDLDFNNFKSSDRGMPIRGQSVSHKRFNRDQNSDDDNDNFIDYITKIWFLLIILLEYSSTL